MAPHAHPRRSEQRKERPADARHDAAKEDATTAANTTKGVAEANDWRAKNEPPELSIEAQRPPHEQPAPERRQDTCLRELATMHEACRSGRTRLKTLGSVFTATA